MRVNKRSRTPRLVLAGRWWAARLRSRLAIVFLREACVFAWRKVAYLGWNGTAGQRDFFGIPAYAGIEAILREQMTAG